MDTPDCGSEHMASCPYNPLHLVRRSRLQGHIIKCQKQFPHYMICPYNATHRFPEREMKEHFEKCPNKLPNTPELTESTLLNNNSDRSTINSKSYQSSMYSGNSVASSDPPRLEKSSSYLVSLESEVIRPLVVIRPNLICKPLPETDPNHEFWDD